MLKVVIISHPKDPEAAVERFLNEVVDVENRYNNKLLPDIIRNILLTQPKGYVAFIEKALQEIGRLEKIYGKDVELTHNEITRMYMRDRENSEITIGKFLEEMETLKQLYKDNKLVTPSMIKRCILIYPDHEKGRQYLKNMIASIENLMATYGKDGDITLAVIRETVLAYKNPEAEIRKILKLFS
jgi:hypothetical protein